MQSFSAAAVATTSRDLSLIHRLYVMLLLLSLPNFSQSADHFITHNLTHAPGKVLVKGPESKNENNRNHNPEQWTSRPAIKSEIVSDLNVERKDHQMSKLYTKSWRKTIHYERTKCLSRVDHGSQALHNSAYDVSSGKVNNVISIMKTTIRPLGRFDSSNPRDRRLRRSYIHESGDSVLAKLPAGKQLDSREEPNNSLNWTSDPNVIQIDCFCTKTHRLRVLPQQVEQQHGADQREKSSHVYLQIHTKPCNQSQSDPHDMHAHQPIASGICLIDMTLLTMHDWITGLHFDPIDSHVRLRDGFEPNAPTLPSSPDHSFMIHLSTDFIRIESEQESVLRTEILLKGKTNWESWIAFYLLACASGLSIICILLAFLYLNLSRRKMSRATATTSPGSNSDNCPSSLSDMGEEEEQQQQRTNECFEMSDYPVNKDNPNPLINKRESSTFTSIPLTSSSTVLE